MKKMSMLLAAFMAVLAVVPLGGCAKKIANDENTLEIYIGNFGYGYEWLDDVIAAFLASPSGAGFELVGSGPTEVPGGSDTHFHARLRRR